MMKNMIMLYRKNCDSAKQVERNDEEDNYDDDTDANDKDDGSDDEENCDQEEKMITMKKKTLMTRWFWKIFTEEKEEEEEIEYDADEDDPYSKWSYYWTGSCCLNMILQFI